MEGGIAVAPASFGPYGGDFVAPGETSGRVFAIGPDGSVVTLVVSALPHGGDIGVESAGFVPPGFSADDAAHLSCTARYRRRPAIDPRRRTHRVHQRRPLAPAAPGAGAGGRLTDARPEVAAGFHRPVGTPRRKLMSITGPVSGKVTGPVSMTKLAEPAAGDASSATAGRVCSTSERQRIGQNDGCLNATPSSEGKAGCLIPGGLFFCGCQERHDRVGDGIGSSPGQVMTRAVR
jgi:hypothetical protein